MIRSGASEGRVPRNRYAGGAPTWPSRLALGRTPGRAPSRTPPSPVAVNAPTSAAAGHPRVWGADFSRYQASYVARWCRAYRRTEESNAMPSLLRRAADRQAARVRSAAGLLRRRAPLACRRAGLRLLARGLPGDVPSVSPRPGAPLLCRPRRGPGTQPKKAAARELVITLRKRNYSIYDISEALKERQVALSPTAVRELLAAEGFAPLPRRLDDERPTHPRPTIEPVADVRRFSLAPRRFDTPCGGLFLFVPSLVHLHLDTLAKAARLPGSQMIPAGHALRASLALKLWSLERKSHVMALVADEGLALFAGLNASPKKSYLSEYSSRIDHPMTTQLMAAWHERAADEALCPGRSFNLDFHSVPYYGDHPVIERHYVSARSRRQKSVLVFLAQDAEGHAFCYANADLRKGEEAEEVSASSPSGSAPAGSGPGTSCLTRVSPRTRTWPGWTASWGSRSSRSGGGRRPLNGDRRAAGLRLAAVELDVPTRKYRTPRVYEYPVRLAGRDFRQLYIQDLGHDDPTILETNDRRASLAKLTHAVRATARRIAGIDCARAGRSAGWPPRARQSRDWAPPPQPRG